MAEENGTSKYVVLARKTLEVVVGHSAPEDGGNPKAETRHETYWYEIACVLVPPRTKRGTILRKALGETPIAGVYRVLDEESGRDMAVSLEEQPPRLKIG